MFFPLGAPVIGHRERDQLGEHVGYVAGRYRDGTRSDAWTDVTRCAFRTFGAYLPACACGWVGSDRRATSEGYQDCHRQWHVEHSPARTLTYISDGVGPRMPQLFSDDMCDNAASNTPAGTGRFTHPQELADVVLLGSGRDGNLTGSDMVIDGGLVHIL